jgi:hypothetical protein
MRSAQKVKAESGQMHSGGYRQFGYNRDSTINKREVSPLRLTAKRVVEGESLNCPLNPCLIRPSRDMG